MAKTGVYREAEVAAGTSSRRGRVIRVDVVTDSSVGIGVGIGGTCRMSSKLQPGVFVEDGGRSRALRPGVGVSAGTARASGKRTAARSDLRDILTSKLEIEEAERRWNSEEIC